MPQRYEEEAWEVSTRARILLRGGRGLEPLEIEFVTVNISLLGEFWHSSRVQRAQDENGLKEMIQDAGPLEPATIVRFPSVDAALTAFAGLSGERLQGPLDDALREFPLPILSSPPANWRKLKYLLSDPDPMALPAAAVLVKATSAGTGSIELLLFLFGATVVVRVADPVLTVIGERASDRLKQIFYSPDE